MKWLLICGHPCAADEKTSYTFFAPTDDAIATALPQDVSNPFYDNDQFRRNVLLAHFVRHRLSDEEFRQRSVLTMANNETAVITRSAGLPISKNLSSYDKFFILYPGFLQEGVCSSTERL